MSTVIERACEKAARYVWIYQDHIAPGDICPILEICEVEVFGTLRFVHMKEAMLKALFRYYFLITYKLPTSIVILDDKKLIMSRFFSNLFTLDVMLCEILNAFHTYGMSTKCTSLRSSGLAALERNLVIRWLL